MEQTMIYEFLGVHQDPLYRELEKMKQEESTNIGNMTVRLNKNSIYEVSAKDIHNGFSDVAACYRFLIEILKKVESN